MTNLEKSEIARAYYDSCKGINLVNGFEKFVATDGVNAMFVNSDYEPETEDISVYRIDTRRGTTCVQFYKPRQNK